jgi:hypothetical protein
MNKRRRREGLNEGTKERMNTRRRREGPKEGTNERMNKRKKGGRVKGRKRG